MTDGMQHIEVKQDGETVAIEIETGAIGGPDYYPAITVGFDPLELPQFTIRVESELDSARNQTRFAVHHGRSIEWADSSHRTGTSVVVKVDAIRELAEEIFPLLVTVRDGHEVEWDGSNYVGRLTQAAQDASERIGEMVDACEWEDESAVVWSAAEWIGQHWTASALDAVEEWGISLDDIQNPEAATEKLKQAATEAAERDGVYIQGACGYPAAMLVSEAVVEAADAADSADELA